MALAGEALYTARSNRRLTQAKAAEALGITVVTLSKWENGKTEPTLSQLAAMSRMYRVSTDQLCGLKPIKQRPAKA